MIARLTVVEANMSGRVELNGNARSVAQELGRTVIVAAPPPPGPIASSRERIWAVAVWLKEHNVEPLTLKYLENTVEEAEVWVFYGDFEVLTEDSPLKVQALLKHETDVQKPHVEVRARILHRVDLVAVTYGPTTMDRLLAIPKEEP